MNKIVILHNVHDKKSRDFVEACGDGYQIIDWYGDTTNTLREEYCSKCMPGINSFPSVVDTEQKAIYTCPETMQVALDYFADYVNIVIQQNRNFKLMDIRNSRYYKLIEVDVMINELALGKRTDSAAINTYRDALLNITDTYKDENDNATSAIDSIDFATFEWPVKP